MRVSYLCRSDIYICVCAIRLLSCRNQETDDTVRERCLSYTYVYDKVVSPGMPLFLFTACVRRMSTVFYFIYYVVVIHVDEYIQNSTRAGNGIPVPESVREKDSHFHFVQTSPTNSS